MPLWFVGRDLCVPPPVCTIPYAECRLIPPRRRAALPATTGVGAGIPDGPGWGAASLTAPDGVRCGRVKDATPYERDGLPCVVCWAVTSSDAVRHKAAVRHPLWGGDGGLRLRRGLRHLRMALWTTGVFRAVRGAGVSPVATGGCFAGCGQREFRPLRRATGALPLDPTIFSRKN